MLVSNATCSDTNAPSHISIAVRGAGTVAAQAERLKWPSVNIWTRATNLPSVVGFGVKVEAFMYNI